MRLLASLLLLFTLVACDKHPASADVLANNFTVEQQQLLQQGSQRARSCAACHGANGISRQALYPSLAGKPAIELVQAMQAFRDGSRKNALMSPQARGLSDADIELLAAYYALLPAAATK
ncbi:c-type cytochrome [Alishewanella tabrizica]|uniref:Cytochrome c domain-containing protein n=1 Tax=Alishewanella tabrizica TaxID=671278 RepID=A0ABQ2WMH3_9ALTE|nr:c-type cytochrome [Alishewanella tabrizica]GGW61134.1 hypothetical protein GCM10008111_16610 [Alishewanella tabrizica]